MSDNPDAFGATRTWVEYGERTVDEPVPADVAALVAAGTPFWLDIERPSDALIDRMASALGLHPLAVEDSKEFAQRSKLVVYGDVAMIVGFGLDMERGAPVEVHGYLAAEFLITFRRAPSVAIDRLHRTGSLRDMLGGEPIRILHHLATALHEEFAQYIDVLEARLRDVERAMLDDSSDEHLSEIVDIQRIADDLRRTVAGGRDVAARSKVAVSMPGDTADAAIYTGDLTDELSLIVDDLASVGERCIAALGLNASLASNRQAIASRQLATVATVFLPVTFVVGFFGMNFEVLINDFEQGWSRFLIFGVLLNMAGVVGTLWLLRRRGLR
ncbi:magnesium transporter CorA family protein [Ilumatobacter sp.]|uniref:magnesium transporter CorA family protein n=1 Tax=Ilumatobacter sp. TaxID=1967498 RepID=UPI003C699B51